MIQKPGLRHCDYLLKGRHDLRWTFAFFTFAFGLFFSELDSIKWLVVTAFIFSLPFLGQFSRTKDVQIYSLWLGFFLVLQTLISPLVTDREILKLPPNIQKTRNVTAGLPGISGVHVFSTDAEGFRTVGNVDYDNDNSLRLFAIGASTTADVSLDDQKTWTHLLQRKLSSHLELPVEVINTGVSGTRAKHHLAMLKHIDGLNPDLAIFLLGINDWNHQIVQEFQGEGWRKEFIDFRKKYSFSDSLLGESILAASRLANSTTEDRGDYYTHQRNSLERDDKRNFMPKSVSDTYRNTLTEISETCNKLEIECLFITQPSGYQKEASEEFKKGFWMTPPNQKYTLDFQSMRHLASLFNNFLVRFSADNGHYVCDAAAKLPPSYDVFYDDCHFNTNGAAMMSDIVSNCVADFLKQYAIPELESNATDSVHNNRSIPEFTVTAQ